MITEFQKRIIERVLDGKKNVEIAEELGYSENWIAKNLKKIYDFFEVKNRASFILKFVKNYQNYDL